MKLKLKNIGTLKQAEIDLSKDLIILAGPNNTGKTYAAYTVYGICDLLKNISTYLVPSYRIQEIVVKNDARLKSGYQTINIEDFINHLLVSLSSILETGGVQQLGNIFGTDSSFFSDAIIDLSLKKNELITYFTECSFEKEFIIGNNPEKITLDKDKNEKSFKILSPPNIDWNKYLGTNGLLIHIANYFFENIINYYYNNLYINTAERSAINIFSKELSIKRNTIVDQLLELRDTKNGDANQLLRKLQRYPLPIRDSLAISEDLANLSRSKSEYVFLADRIEEVLLDGKITTSKEGEVQYSPNKSKVKNLSIHLTASIVKSLSNLVFYFRHLAQKGDFIIIDEPELNLHPDNQRKVARILGEIINQGFKIMISTHSDYIIRELNNLIMLKSGGEKATHLANKYGYEENQLIDYQRVGAYLFNHNKNTSLEVTETGFEVSTIDEVINELNNASEEIYFTLFD